jgi:hypothetical protein
VRMLKRTRSVSIFACLALFALPHTAAVARAPDALLAARQALAEQAARLGVAPVGVATVHHQDLAEAVRALIARHSEVTEDTAGSLARLETLPTSENAALTAVVDAFIAFDDAVRRRKQAVSPVDPMGGLTDVLAARAALFDSAAAASRQSSMSSAFDGSPLQLPPWFALSTGVVNDSYAVDFVLTIDMGGDDSYQNNAGGSNVHGGACEFATVTPSAAAALIDLGGRDTYESGRSCGANGGGAALGAGFLYDGGPGDDSYIAGGFGTNGGGDFGGVGFLYDESGATSYKAGANGTNGGGALGLGLLVDGGGDDSYDATDSGTNGGSALGAGGLLDLSGTDSYWAGSVGTNGGANGGTASLVDLSGDDAYVAGGTGANGGGSAGTGLLLDGGGLDTYTDMQGGSGTNKTVAPKGAVGAQFDVPG